MKDAAEIIAGIHKAESLCRTPQLRSILAQLLTIAEGLAELEKALAALREEPDQEQPKDK